MAEAVQLPPIDINPQAVIKALQQRHAQKEADSDLQIATLSAAVDTLQEQLAGCQGSVTELAPSLNREQRRAAVKNGQKRPT